MPSRQPATATTKLVRPCAANIPAAMQVRSSLTKVEAAKSSTSASGATCASVSANIKLS
jgi:hypothetical protein